MFFRFSSNLVVHRFELRSVVAVRFGGFSLSLFIVGKQEMSYLFRRFWNRTSSLRLQRFKVTTGEVKSFCRCTRSARFVFFGTGFAIDSWRMYRKNVSSDVVLLSPVWCVVLESFSTMIRVKIVRGKTTKVLVPMYVLSYTRARHLTQDLIGARVTCKFWKSNIYCYNKRLIQSWTSKTIPKYRSCSVQQHRRVRGPTCPKQCAEYQVYSVHESSG